MEGTNKNLKKLKCPKRKCTFANQVIKKRHEMENIQQIITMSHRENNHAKTNKLEEPEIIKGAISPNIQKTSSLTRMINFSKPFPQLAVNN